MGCRTTPDRTGAFRATASLHPSERGGGGGARKRGASAARRDGRCTGSPCQGPRRRRDRFKTGGRGTTKTRTPAQSASGCDDAGRRNIGLVLVQNFSREYAQLTEQVQLAKAAAARATAAEEQARSDQKRAQHSELNAITNECTASKLLLDTKPSDEENLYNYLSCGLRLGFALIREKRPEDSRKFFGQIREGATQKGTDQGDPILSFYLLLVSQGVAVAECAMTELKSKARSDGIGQLVLATNQVLQFQPPTSIEQRWHKELEKRWREELFRGLLYISNFSDESGDHELAFQYASKLADRLSNMPLGSDGSAREFARSLDHLTWMALIAKRNGEALKASERAKQIVQEFRVKDLDSIRLNHAHALLFNGRTDEARKEYQSLNPDDVAKDVTRLMAVGLCDQIFVELVGTLGKCQNL